jgi:hypothetical protein
MLYLKTNSLRRVETEFNNIIRVQDISLNATKTQGIRDVVYKIRVISEIAESDFENDL